MTIDAELKQLEELLEGKNYTVFFQVYKVHHSGADARTIVSKCFPDATVGKVIVCDTKAALASFDRDVQYRGDASHGPDVGLIDSPEFKSAFAKVRSRFHASCESACGLHKFRLTDGHPAYPVFWEFGFLLQFVDNLEIWIGSSSD